MFTLGQAAKETGKSKATLSRDIRKGKFSARKKDDGSYEIDPAELFRVYPKAETDKTVTGETPAAFETVSRNSVLQDKLEALEQERERERKQLEALIDDLRKDRDEWRGQAERVTHLLTHQTASPKKKTVLNRIFGIK